MTAGAAEPGFEGEVEIVDGDLGEEAEGAEIDGEDGGLGLGEGAGGGEEGAIAAEDDDEVGMVAGELGAEGGGAVGAEVGGAFAIEDAGEVAGFEPADEIVEDLRELRLLGLGDDRGQGHGYGASVRGWRGLWNRVDASLGRREVRSPGRSGRGGGTRGLPSMPWMGESMMAVWWPPRARTAAWTRSMAN